MTAACQKIESNIKVINALSCIVLSFVSVRLIELLKLLIYIQFFNPLNPKIKIEILIYCPPTFSIEVVGRIC